MTELNARQEEFAKALFEAYDTNTPLKEEEWKDVVTDDETAYAVQDAVVKLKGKPTAGYKVSLTSKETQDMFDADSPLYGQQVAERFLQSPADVDLQMLNEPLLEVELTFRAKEDLQPSDTLEDLFHKVTVDRQGQRNIFGNCQRVQEIKVLKDKAEVFPAKPGQCLFLDFGYIGSIQIDVARTDRINRRNAVQQRCLAGAGRAHNADKFTLAHRKTNVIDCLCDISLVSVEFLDMIQLQNFVHWVHLHSHCK